MIILTQQQLDSIIQNSQNKSKETISGIKCCKCGSLFCENMTIRQLYNLLYKRHKKEIIDKDLFCKNCLTIFIKETNLINKYGSIENGYKALYKKQKQTLKEKYGYENPFELESVKEKIKSTHIKKYGSYENYCKIVCGSMRGKILTKEQKEIKKEKMFKTTFEKYGEYAYSFLQTKEGQKHRRNIIYFDNIYFDSKAELNVYKYCKKHKISIERHPVEFVFKFNDKIYKYFPDFKINNILIEIKGEHFIKEDGSWQNPYNHLEDDLYEAKHQCALNNNVKIIKSKDIYIFLDNINKGDFE